MPVDVEARVISNTRLSPDYNVIALAAPEIADATAPGQFVMVKPGRGGDPLLRRPFSVFEVLRDQRTRRPASRCSASASASRRDCSSTRSKATSSRASARSAGPSSSSIRRREAWMVAGGVGLAPFATLAEALVARGTTTTLFYGARSGEELFYLDWFASRGVTLVLATEDGTQRRPRPRHGAARARAAAGAGRPT